MSVKIRTITYFTPLTPTALNRSVNFFDVARPKFREAGYVVQDCRIGTDSKQLELEEMRKLDQELKERELILNLGPFKDPDEIKIWMAETENVYFSYALPDKCPGDVFGELAELILQMASESGFYANFRFCVMSQCPPYIPFFPACHALTEDPPSFAIGLESSGILDTLEVCGGVDQISSKLQSALSPILEDIERICRDIQDATGVTYRHIDNSLCPRLEPPAMTEFWKRFGISEFGKPGTLTLCAAITKALKSCQVQLGGFCGLMLPVCEDAGLIHAADQGAFDISDLLYYSTVCACGLDCVPVPGYSKNQEENKMTEHKIAGYLSDMHTIAVRLKKPLACRLLPVPGKKFGDPTGYNFKYLVDGCIMEL